jgi:HAD superfamily hydrolase (TIGR01509 family)
MLRGVIFDLDGTLVDTGLDFHLIRREMGLPQGVPILEALAAAADDGHAERRWAILADHEARGVERATLYPGVLEFFEELERRTVKRAVLTRNSRTSAVATLARFDIEVHLIHAREDGPVKPDPAGIWRICEHWGLEPRECAMIGDYRFDIEAGRAAGTRTVLFAGGRKHSVLAPGEEADYTLASFADVAGFWRWAEVE